MRTARPAQRRGLAVASLIALAALAALGGVTAGAGPAHADSSSSASSSSGPLADPTNDDALLNMLMENGVQYTTSTTVPDATSYSGSDSTLVIDEDETGLSLADISELSSAPWGRVIVLSEDRNLIDAFAPGVTAVSRVLPTATDPAGSDGTVAAQCGQPDASAAGQAVMPSGTVVYQLPASASSAASAGPPASDGSTGSPDGSAPIHDVTGCFPIGDPAAPAMVSLRNDSTGGDVILLGWSDFAENQYLAQQGDAALALRLFGAHGTLVWLATQFIDDQNLNDCRGAACFSGGGTAPPATASAGGSGAGGGGGLGGNGNQRGNGNATQLPTLVQLMPHWIWWMLLQLVVAVAALAYWRSRRLGRLVGESLPVKVRAAETVEGHANLYRRAGAHSRAAGLLRSAAARRIAPLLGLPPGPAGREPASLVGPLAQRLGRPPEQLHAVLAGTTPATEAELVHLTDQLDRLEQEVRSP